MEQKYLCPVPWFFFFSWREYLKLAKKWVLVFQLEASKEKKHLSFTGLLTSITFSCMATLHHRSHQVLNKQEKKKVGHCSGSQKLDLWATWSYIYTHTHTKRKLENYVLDRGASRLAMARSKAGWQLFYIRFFFNLLLVVVIKCLITASTDHSSLPRNGRPSTRLNRQRQPEPVAARRGVKCFRVPAFAKACVPWRQPRIRLWLPRITQQCSSSLDRGKWRFSPSFFFVYILSIIFNLQGANFEKKRMEHRAASQQLKIRRLVRYNA